MNLAQENLLQDISRLVVWYPFRWLTRVLPLRTKMRLFEYCGDFAFTIYKKKRTLLDRRLALALPHLTSSQRQENIRASFRNYFVDRFLINLVPDLDGHQIDSLASLDGEEYLRQAQEQGRGVVLIHAHFGPSQLPLIYLGYKGYCLAQLGLREHVETSAIGQATQDLRWQLEHQMPVTHFYANDYLRPVVRWLGQGHILMTAGDGTGGGRHIGKFQSVQLLGHRMSMPIGAYRLAAARQSPILTIIALRQRCGYYQIIIRPFMDADAGHLKNPQQQFAAWLEPYLAQTPGQWHFWDEWDLESGSDILNTLLPLDRESQLPPRGGLKPWTYQPEAGASDRSMGFQPTAATKHSSKGLGTR
jgi:phosphatidylinositol dimannoside acyltransferase